ncbi:MAG: ABC transporter ATP-binding protein [Candidatus Diapherotrites archaeon CG08_land_8_20_14_0_20_30_16]|nr:MAG: ABC transporter ATP-binding protein [Candidatus Diapherotrites archaeon CG08_land_8_20_14_0_20_30_16]
MSEAVLKISNLRKSFGKKQVLTGVSFEAYAGQCIGLLGPNGAGKSTVSKLITKLIEKDDGKIFVLGTDQDKDFHSIKKHITLVPQDFAFYMELTVKDNLQYFSKAYGLSRKERKNVIPKLIDDLSLSKFTNTKAQKLSGGYKRLLNIAISLLHNPTLILLDEPTVALDTDMRIKVWEVITKLKEQGKTLILTTHYLDEAQKLCDKIAILKEGRIILFGTPKEIQEKFARTVRIELILSKAIGDTILSQIKRKFNAIETNEDKTRIVISSENVLNTLTDVVYLIESKRLIVKDTNIFMPTLEDAFENIIKG